MYLGHDGLVGGEVRLAVLAAENAILVQVDVVDESHFQILALLNVLLDPDVG